MLGTSFVFDQILAAALTATNAEMGNIQLVDPASGALKIVASCYFSWRFLQFFDTVETRTAACGAALHQQARVTVENVPDSALFRGTPALNIMLDAQALAVQSTPLVGRRGQVIGMISTHRSRPGAFTTDQLAAMDRLARDAAESIEQAAITPGSFAWTEARSRVLLHSTTQLIKGTQRWLNDAARAEAPKA